MFLFLSADEALSLHEWLGVQVSSVIPTEGSPFFAWVIPAGIITLGGLIAYAPFTFSFPRDLAMWLLVCAALFLGGAIGVETLAADLVTSGDPNSARADSEAFNTGSYRVLVHVEEGLKGLGVIVFITTLAPYAAREFGVLTLRIARA